MAFLNESWSHESLVEFRNILTNLEFAGLKQQNFARKNKKEGHDLIRHMIWAEKNT